MPELNKDVLFLIFDEFQDNKKTLFSCLLVNKTWCEVIVPMLWKDHMKDLKKKKDSLKLIISHLSNETIENLKSQGIDVSMIQLKQKPLFNYICFCRYLNLYRLESMMSSMRKMRNIGKSKIPIIGNEVMKLFVNKNTRYTHIYIPRRFEYQIHLIPGAEHCFSEFNFLQCRTNTNQNILEGFARINQSIEKLELDVAKSGNNYGIFKLIEAQTNLVDVSLTYFIRRKDKSHESLCKTLEESLIKHANTIKHLRIDWKPIANILSYLINLISLEISIRCTNWGYLENPSLPALRILKAHSVPSKSLTSLIKSTNGHLTEINILYEGNDNKRLIQAIYQNCPNLKYLQLSLNNGNLLEFEKLLTSCQYLEGLVILTNSNRTEGFVWNNLFKMLSESSPANLYKFKFYLYAYYTIELNPITLFFDNWRGRHPMVLKTTATTYFIPRNYFSLINKYKSEGIIEEYREDLTTPTFNDFDEFKNRI